MDRENSALTVKVEDRRELLKQMGALLGTALIGDWGFNEGRASRSIWPNFGRHGQESEQEPAPKYIYDTFEYSSTPDLGEWDDPVRNIVRTDGTKTNQIELADLDPNDMEQVRGRVDFLREQSAENIARYIQTGGSEFITYDIKHDRVRQSIDWAAQFGVVPLVDTPTGDLDPEVSSPSIEQLGTGHVPVSKDLLILLAVAADSKIPIRVTSLGTSDAHVFNSHHYRGTGMDIGLGDSTEYRESVMNLFRNMHIEGIVQLDELFGKADVRHLNIDGGELAPNGGEVETNHMHIAVQNAYNGEVYRDPVFETTYATAEAQLAADELGVSHAKYFHTDYELGQKLAESGYGYESVSDSSLVNGVFPDRVNQHHQIVVDAVNELAAETDASGNPLYAQDPPVNFLKALMTMESGGNTEALSEDNAVGILQMVPEVHFQIIDNDMQNSGIESTGSNEERAEYLNNNPDRAIYLAAQHIAKDLLPAARRARPELHHDHPAIYALTALGYHSGPVIDKVPTNEDIKSTADNIGKRSEMYYRIVAAFAHEIAVAQKVVENGTDPAFVGDVMKSSRGSELKYQGIQQFDGFNDNRYKYYRLAEMLHPGIVGPNVRVDLPDTELSEREIATYRRNVHLAASNYKQTQFDQMPEGLTNIEAFMFVHGFRSHLN